MSGQDKNKNRRNELKTTKNENNGKNASPRDYRRSRRQVLAATAAGIGTAALAGCSGGGGGNGGGSDSLTVSVFGGAFKDILDDALFAPFEEETGITTQSEAQGGAAEVIPNLEGAVRSGNAPVDLLIMTVPGALRGINSDLWHRWSADEFENTQYLEDDLITRDDGDIIGVGSMGWFINLVHNTEEFDSPLTSWNELWDAQYEEQLAMMSPAVTGFLPDITAEVRLSGQEMLQTEEGIREVFQELSGIVPQSALWYTNEANFQSRLASGEIPGGMLYHDITRVLRVTQDAPVESTFPDEGAVLGSGRWVSPRTTENTEAARQLIDYASRPEVQDRITQELFTFPAIEEQYSELSDEAYQRAAGPGIEEAILPNFELYVEQEQLINQLWNELIVQQQ
jgi:putative spermidine/putrescine transport system substrate-binding protein